MKAVMAEEYTVNLLSLEMAGEDTVLLDGASGKFHRRPFIHEHNFCLCYLLSFVSGGQSSPSLRSSSLHLGKFLHRLMLGSGCQGLMVRAEAVISGMQGHEAARVLDRALSGTITLA